MHIECVNFTDPRTGHKVTILDTPGFNDSAISDTDILKMITDFLLNQYGANRKLNGIVYLQRISDPRFGGLNRRTLRMLKKLCGTDRYTNIVVLTTFWDILSKQEGEERERHIRNNFFRELLEGGAAYMRHDREYTVTGQRVVDRCLNYEGGA
ncbi:hypothetical protein BDP27DRAFT_1240552 [Rhodocollybia butyracea]|uniref:AIG1-type G domain-containing protein n=1 Tax=Rhodocollybia butyracea TaxID=206335 RepID=A0A9P5P8D1_9AGAR|nr:hypothetical protein BDP27DRAFT_1240552 [Rhodocollybia butyracea]